MSNDEIPSEGQIDLLKQMNDLLKEQAKMFEKVAAAMGTAANASQQMKTRQNSRMKKLLTRRIWGLKLLKT